MIASLGFNDGAVVRFFVLLQLTGSTLVPFVNTRRSRTLPGLGIKNVDDVAQAESIVAQQVTELFLELDFFLQLR